MSSGTPNPNVTLMLEAVQKGDSAAADQLLPLVYGELKKMAAYLMAKEQPGMTLQPTALVHDAYLRLVGAENQGWENRRHFFNAAAIAMRRVLLDRARRYSRDKHGGGMARSEMDAVDIPATREFPQERWENLEGALEELGKHNPRWGEIVNLRFFVGLSIEHTAEVLGLSVATVKSDWMFARAWLKHRVSET